MNDYIDLYCERVLPGLLGEPFNAISNISFFIAAWGIWQIARKQQIKIPIGIYILISLTIIIGIGSTLFHSFATKWSYFFDVIPVLIFQLCFLWLYSHHIIKMKYFQTGLLIVSFLFLANFSRQLLFSDLLNGSLGYTPSVLLTLGLGIYHYQQQKHEPLILLTALVAFLVSILFRSIDLIVCPYFEYGTHFLWHIFNGILLYLSARALIVNWSNK
jgi:hypothetical protein